MEVTLAGEVRSASGKGPARRARASGKVPGIVYGRSLEPLSVLVGVRDLTHALKTEAGHNVLVTLKVDGSDYLTMLREIQRDPVRGDFIHVDFVSIDRDVKIHADVPIHLTGQARGVVEGGVVEHHKWELKVEVLPASVPSFIEVDMTSLEIGGHVRVADVQVPDGVELLDDPEEIIASVMAPQVQALPEPGAEAEAAVAAEEGEAAEGAGGEAASGEESGGAGPGSE